ncbi:hypothetical protein TURU_166800 [Turdus rufiventris]|nr:hypothetical protein TURU_166800 [Turdus rufiventris]
MMSLEGKRVAVVGKNAKSVPDEERILFVESGAVSNGGVSIRTKPSQFTGNPPRETCALGPKTRHRELKVRMMLFNCKRTVQSEIKFHKPRNSLVFQLHSLYSSTEMNDKEQWIEREPGQVQQQRNVKAISTQGTGVNLAILNGIAKNNEIELQKYTIKTVYGGLHNSIGH